MKQFAFIKVILVQCPNFMGGLDGNAASTKSFGSHYQLEIDYNTVHLMYLFVALTEDTSSNLTSKCVTLHLNK